MDTPNEAIDKAEAALAETIARCGDGHLDVSYRLDDLADALKAGGRALDAANAIARAKKIRSRLYTHESEEQQEKFGDASQPDQGMSTVAWMKHLYRGSIIAVSAILLLTFFIHPQKADLQLWREFIGSSAAATLVQLLLLPLKDIPGFLKGTVTLIATSLIWMAVGGGGGGENGEAGGSLNEIMHKVRDLSLR